MNDTILDGEANTPRNEVSCADNIVFYVMGAPVDTEEAVRLSSVGTECVNGGEAQYVLIDLQQSTQFSSSARKIWVEFLQNDKIKKTALFGGNMFVKTLATIVISATGKKDIKFFNNKEEALTWIKE